MKKNFLLLLALLSLVFMTTAAMAASHEQGAAPAAQTPPGQEMPMGHEMPMGQGMPMGNEMAMGDAQMIMLGTNVVERVKAEAHLNDVKEAMAKMGMKETHHFMVMFQEVETGKAVETGTAALKIKGPDNVESDAIPLMGMGGHFGADIVLGAPGMYTFTIGTKLADGKTRQFQFSHELK